MPTSLGTIPEDFPSNEVYSLDLGDTMPNSVTGRRANFEELIWDQDGGFAPEWIGRSSVGGTGGMGDPFVMMLQRSSFSAAGLALFRYDGGSGGGGEPTGPAGGDLDGTYPNPTVKGLWGEAIPTPTTGVLTFDGSDLTWTVPGGTGDVIGPAGSVDDRIATFDSTTGKLIQDGGKTIAQVEASAVATAQTAVCYMGQYVGNTAPTATTWTGFTSMLPGTLTDVINAKGIVRSGNTFTFSLAGYYRFEAGFMSFGQDHFLELRLRTAGGVTVLKQSRYGASSTPAAPSCTLAGIIQVTAGQVLTLQYARGASTGGATSNTTDGEVQSFGFINAQFIGT